MPRTGPVTPEGKARSSLNRLSHGLTAAAIVIPGEDPAEWQQLHDEIAATVAPRDWIERGLADSIAESIWRLRRVSRAEAAFINDAARRTGVPMCLPDPPHLETLLRHESRLSRQLHDALRQLDELRQLREWTDSMAAPAGLAAAAKNARSAKRNRTGAHRATR